MTDQLSDQKTSGFTPERDRPLLSARRRLRTNGYQALGMLFAAAALTGCNSDNRQQKAHALRFDELAEGADPIPLSGNNSFPSHAVGKGDRTIRLKLKSLYPESVDDKDELLPLDKQKLVFGVRMDCEKNQSVKLSIAGAVSGVTSDNCEANNVDIAEPDKDFLKQNFVEVSVDASSDTLKWTVGLGIWDRQP